MAVSSATASLSTLPEELILHIFSFLSAEDLMLGVGATCQHFYNLSRNPGFWKRVTVTKREPRRGNRFCEELFLRKMLQQECVMNNGSDTLPVREVIRSVEETGDVWPSCSITGAMHYPNLERLTLVRRHLPSLEVLVMHKKLRHLKLCTNPFLVDDNGLNSRGQLVTDLCENLEGLTNLQTLTLRFNCMMCHKNKSFISDMQAAMKDYFLTGPRLRQIELRSFVNDKIFQAIWDNCLQLEDLAMIYPDLSPEAFCATVSGKRQLLLSALRIEECETLNDKCLKALSAACPDIKSLDLCLTKEITNDGLGLFLKTCSQLTDLKLTSNASNGHTMLGGKTSTNLQHLGLTSITFSSPSAFQKLCQYSQNLHEIDLCSTNMNNTDVVTLANSCRLLEDVSLLECSHVDSIGVAYIMKNLPRLQNLRCGLSEPHLFSLERLSSSKKRTRAGGLVLKNQAGPTENRLRSLVLEPCQKLTAVGVSALANLCPNLRDLEISATSGANDRTVRRILRKLPELQSLKLETISDNSRRNQLTRACLRHVQRWGTRLQSLKLMTRYRSFTIAALFNLLAHSSTLVHCEVPCQTEQTPDMPACELGRLVKEEEFQLHRLGKKAVCRVSHTDAVSQHVLVMSILRR